MDELKPCPFCGEDAEHIHVYQYEETVRCTNACCFVRPSVTCQLPEECFELWNRRAALAATQPHRGDMAKLFEILMQQNIVTGTESYLSLRCVGVPPTEEEFVSAVSRILYAAPESSVSSKEE